MYIWSTWKYVCRYLTRSAWGAYGNALKDLWLFILQKPMNSSLDCKITATFDGGAAGEYFSIP